METCIWILLLIGVATTSIRLSWLDRAWPGLIVASVWASIPWLASDWASQTNGAGLFGWASQPDHVGAIATLAVVEALVGGWSALRHAGTSAGGGDQTMRRKAWIWASALTPSPSLAIGIVGAQASLFHRASGWGFTSLNAALSAGVFEALVGLALVARFLRREPSRRAGAAVPLFAGLFVFGAALPPLLDKRPAPSKLVEVDVRATAFVVLVVTMAAGLGLAARMVRYQSKTKGAKAR